MFKDEQKNNSLSLLFLLVKRELKVKYRGSILGYLWSMLNPLLFMIIISFVFSKLMRGVENYELYVLSGILFWNTTALSLVGSTNSLVNNAGLLQKVKTPIWIFATVPLGSALINLILAIVPYLLFMLFKGVAIPSSIILLPLFLIVYSVFLTGINLTLSILNVYFRDVAHVLEPVLQLIFYATPIIYDRSNPALPEKIKDLLGLNPFTQFVEIFRDLVFQQKPLAASQIITTLLISAISLVIGIYVYSKHHRKIIFKL